MEHAHCGICEIGALFHKIHGVQHMHEKSTVISKVSLVIFQNAWWRHQMETFSALLDICAGNSPVPGEFPTQSPVTRNFDVFLDLRLNKRLSKQAWDWWFESISRPLWRHRNVRSLPSSAIWQEDLRSNQTVCSSQDPFRVNKRPATIPKIYQSRPASLFPHDVTTDDVGKSGCVRRYGGTGQQENSGEHHLN